ncbi:hypothetical protein L9F63_009403, partial [Diploptera punctata]
IIMNNCYLAHVYLPLELATRNILFPEIWVIPIILLKDYEKPEIHKKMQKLLSLRTKGFPSREWCMWSPINSNADHKASNSSLVAATFNVYEIILIIQAKSFEIELRHSKSVEIEFRHDI